jgi:aminopeptidase N
MIRMMMWSSHDKDDRFRATMHDFLNTYRLRAATTEDFKAVVEKHMSPQMNLDNNQRMDWFFNQYVYGTDLPSYHFESQVTPNAEGSSIHFKLTQSGVPPTFKMPVPIYLEMADGTVLHLGRVAIVGSTPVEQTVQVPKLSSPIKRVSINDFYDVLSTEN